MIWLVVYLPLWKVWKSVGIIIPNIWKNKTCSKPPARYIIYNDISIHMSDRQNFNWKMRSRGKVIVFGTSLYRFTVYPDCIIRIPWQTACGKPFYTSTSRLGHLWLPCAFFSSASTVWWVWCDTRQRNCKSQLHHPFSSSETSFEFSLLEENRVSSHSDMLHAFHSLASVCAANHRPGPTPLPWLSSSRIKIVKPDLQVQLCLRWTGID